MSNAMFRTILPNHSSIFCQFYHEKILLKKYTKLNQESKISYNDFWLFVLFSTYSLFLNSKTWFYVHIDTALL